MLWQTFLWEVAHSASHTQESSQCGVNAQTESSTDFVIFFFLPPQNAVVLPTVEKF